MSLLNRIREVGARYKAKLRDKKILSEHKSTPGLDIFAGKRIEFNNGEAYLKQRNEIFYRRIYQFKTQNPTPRIIDCGGNIGLSAIFFKQFYPNSQLTVFEADPNIANICRKNMEAFGFNDGVEVVSKAVWTEDTELVFDARGSASGRIDATGNSVHKVVIPAINFSDYLKHESTIDMLKIDIEGAENDLIASIQSALPKVKNIFLEYHCLQEQGQRLQEILQILLDNGFRYYLESELILSEQPFMERGTLEGFDTMILVFGFRPTE
jgi:FkbM family methyltransferase